MSQGTVVTVGPFSSTSRSVCLAACRSAGISSATLFGFGGRNALVMGENGDLLFVRWGAGRKPRPSWTRDPSLFSSGWKTRVKAKLEELCSDPDAPERVLRGIRKAAVA